MEEDEGTFCGWQRVFHMTVLEQERNPCISVRSTFLYFDKFWSVHTPHCFVSCIQCRSRNITGHLLCVCVYSCVMGYYLMMTGLKYDFAHLVVQ